MIAVVPDGLDTLTAYDAGEDLDRVQRDLMVAWVERDRMLMWIARNGRHPLDCGRMRPQDRACTCGLNDILTSYDPALT